MRLFVGLGILALAASAVWAQTPRPAPRARAVLAAAAEEPASYLGIGTADIAADRAKALNLKEDRGVEVTAVGENSPAAKAGFKVGDVVLDYNGDKVEGAAQLQRLVRETPVGRQVKIGVWRDGKMQTLMATTAERKGLTIISPDGKAIMAMPNMNIRMPDMNIRIPQMDIPHFEMIFSSRMLGITGESLGQQSQLAEFFGVKEGVLVKSVNKDSAAEKAGIKAGDVIVKIDDAKVSSTDEILRALRSPGKSNFSVVVVRNKREMPLNVTIETHTGGGMRAWVRAINC